MFEDVDKLPDAPWYLTGSYMTPESRTVEVHTISQLAYEMNKLLELSPTGEVLVRKENDETDEDNLPLADPHTVGHG